MTVNLKTGDTRISLEHNNRFKVQIDVAYDALVQEEGEEKKDTNFQPSPIRQSYVVVVDIKAPHWLVCHETPIINEYI